MVERGPVVLVWAEDVLVPLEQRLGVLVIDDVVDEVTRERAVGAALDHREVCRRRAVWFSYFCIDKIPCGPIEKR